jgi:hypothetical protein
LTKNFITIFLLLSNINSFSQTTCDSISLLKKKVYGFNPSELSDSLKALKSKNMDLFWSTAQDNPKEAAPCLEAMIEKENADLFFCYDASMLLFQLDTTDKYYQSIINGLKKCNLKDLQLEPYLTICFFLEKKGKDIGELATKLIGTPNATVYLTNHVITLNSIDASIFLFNNMPEEIAEKVLVSAIMNGNSFAKHNASVLLNLLATKSGDSLLNALITKRQLADSTVQFIRKDRKTLIINPKGSESRFKVLESLDDVPYNMEKEFFGFAGNDELIGSACKQLTKQDIGKIRKARVKSTPVLSDEALHEYFTLTTILMTVRDKKE